MTTTHETPSLHDVIDDLPLNDEQRRALWRAMADQARRAGEMRDQAQQRRNERPPLLDLLERARPFAERLVYREGITPELGASDLDCVDGFQRVAGEWCDLAIADAMRFFGEKPDDEQAAIDHAYQMRDAGYILGVAVGLLLRGGTR